MNAVNIAVMTALFSTSTFASVCEGEARAKMLVQAENITKAIALSHDFKWRDVKRPKSLICDPALE